MILPIYTFGQPILRQAVAPIEGDSPELQELIDNMIETMQNAHGVGLAGPQVGENKRLFVIDLTGMAEELAEVNDGEVPSYAQAPLALINPEIVEFDDEEEVEFEEGCLSIPGITEYVVRPDRLRVRFQDRSFEAHELEVSDLLSRVFQHELDHLDGVLFFDHLSPLKKRLLKRRLREMAAGNVEAEYPLEVPGG